MKILVISPHRDDAAFSLTLTIQSWLQQGHRVTVLNCFTRSDYAPFADAGHVHRNDLVSFISALRLREDESWRRQQKSDSLQLLDLNLKDAPLRLRCLLEEICSRTVDPEDRALNRIASALDQMDADAIVLPLALGGHVDHRTAMQAALVKARSMDVAFYEDLPYAAWPSITSGIELYTKDLATSLGEHLTPVKISNGHETAMLQKLRAALCYDSQIDNAAADLIATFSQRYEGAERLWVNPAWLAHQPAFIPISPMHIS